MFKLEHSLKPNFHCVANKALRYILVRFRLNISYIKAHKIDYSADYADDLSCQPCECSLDDKFHFLSFV